MINKEKIANVNIYDKDGQRIISTKSFSFPRDFFKVRGLELVVVKCAGLPVLPREDALTVIFEYINGTRIQCQTSVDISTEEQLNFHVDDGIVLEERRSSFKVKTDASAFIASLMRVVTDENGTEKTEITRFDQKLSAKILNLNLGGVLMSTDFDFSPNDVIVLEMLDGQIILKTQVLRVQLDLDGNRVGYGCRFIKVTLAQEEKIARYIFECQLAEREKLRQTK